MLRSSKYRLLAHYIDRITLEWARYQVEFLASLDNQLGCVLSLENHIVVSRFFKALLGSDLRLWEADL